jgi:hypothetical protein
VARAVLLGKLTANWIASAVHKKHIHEKVSFKFSRSCSCLVAAEPECPSALGLLSSLRLLASPLLAPWLLVWRVLASWILVSWSGYSGRPVLTLTDCQSASRSSGADRSAAVSSGLASTIRAAGIVVSTPTSAKAKPTSLRREGVSRSEISNATPAPSIARVPSMNASSKKVRRVSFTVVNFVGVASR